MDQDSLRAFATLLVFLAFIGLCFRVYSRKNKAYYEEAAQLPFADEKPESADQSDPPDADRGNKP